MIQLGKLKPELLQEKTNILSYCSREELIERYAKVQDILLYERAVGMWLDALADAYREQDDDSWELESNAKEYLNEVKERIKAKYE